MRAAAIVYYYELKVNNFLRDFGSKIDSRMESIRAWRVAFSPPNIFYRKNLVLVLVLVLALFFVLGVGSEGPIIRSTKFVIFWLGK